MADISVSHRESQAPVDDLRQEQERKLNQIRQDYQKREAEVRESGEAVISHIKKANNERADQTRSSGEQKLKRESETINKNYADLKQRSTAQREAMQDQIRDTEEHGHKRID